MANRVNHANQFVPRSVQINTGRKNINYVRSNINTGRTNVNPVRFRVNTITTDVNTIRPRSPVPTRTSNSFSPKRPQVNQFNQKKHFSKSYSSVRRPFTKTIAHSHAVKENWGSAVKTLAGYNWRNFKPNSNCDSGPTFIRTVNAKGHSDRFSWVFFLASKDETSGILQNFIRQIENQLSHRVKIIRSDNGTEFKNRDMLEFCGNKGIKQEYSNARTPQQNGVAERMNRTLIEAARTMLADSLLPTTFWAEAVSTACYIFNRFDGKSDEGFLVGYSLNSKAYRVYNLVTKRVEVNLHVNFLEDKPNVKGVGYRWMFDIDYLTDSMNYIPVSLENQANPHAGASEVTNSAGTSQTPSSNVSEERDEDVELIKEEILTELQQEKNASSTDTSEDNPQILAFKRELEEIALKHLGKEEPKKISEALQDNSWVQAMQEELLQFKLQQVWVLVIYLIEEGDGNLNGSYRNKRDESNEWLTEIKARLVAPRDTHRRTVLTMMRFCSCGKIKLSEEESVDVLTPKLLQHLNAVKRIFKYLKGKPHLGLWYPRESPFDLEAFSDSDYGGSNLDRKSITGGCQFLGQRLISWQCKKQTIVATSTTKAEYVAAANCCGQVLWVQNQLLDYGFNFMNTKIHIDNESTICIVKNLVYHSKTKHIEIRHHFIRDCYEKKLISVEKIHTDLNER
ncbi:putative ribonuclease H-like domain-containing protein [Tanacetum coccineum]